MKAEERENYWREIVRRQEKSGLSVRGFCEQEKLCAHTLYIWRRQFAQKRSVKFAVVRVRPEVEQPGATLELVLHGGEHLRIPAGVDATTLRTVLAALRERA